MKIANHHTKYREIDGIDEVVKVSYSEHTLLQKEARKHRSLIPKRIVFRARDRLRAKNEIIFDTQIETRSGLKERLRYNPNTGHVGYMCYWTKN